MKLFSKWSKRLGALLVMSLGIMSLSAQNALTLMVDGTMNTVACVDEPLVLNARVASGYSVGDVVDVYRSFNGSTWTAIGSTTKDKSGVYTFVEEMVSQKVMYRFVDPANPTQRSNDVTIGVNYDCPEICHVTTTGEYYLGTDFNPSDGCSVRDINFGNNNYCLENHFAANGIRFQGCTAGHVEKGWKTTDVDSVKGVVGNNYYYVFNGGNCSNTPFFLTFDRGKYLNKTFRFTMRLYLDLTNCQSFDEMAKMNFRTSFGNPVDLCVDAEVYDGKTGQHLKDYEDCARGTHLDHSVVLGSDIWGFARNGHRLIRMEIIFYGQFKTQNQEELKIYPEFQQWPACATVAVDYISGEAANVCLGRGAVCVGEDAEVNAAGFPKDAEYIWERYDNGAWQPLYVAGFVQRGKDKQSITIHVDWIGKKKFRVKSDNGHPIDKPIEFEVTGKNCEPVQPTGINGPSNPFCIPNDKNAGKFEVYPMDANTSVKYTWSFETPSGETFGSEKILFNGGQLDTTYRGGSVFLILDSKAEEGEYKVTVQPIKKMIGSDGQPYQALAGSPISKTFMVYKTPQVQVYMEGTDPLAQASIELCPTDKSQKVVAVADVKSGFYSNYVNKYSYTWNDGKLGKRNESTINLPSLGACDGTYKNHRMSVEVGITGVGCPATATQTWKVGKVEKPTIDCESVQDLSYSLGETDKTKEVYLAFPTKYTSGCEKDPMQKIEVAFTPKTGSAISKTFEGKASEMISMEKVVYLPAGTGTVTYSVIDGCGNVASCKKTVEVKDEFPPRLDCDAIPSYTTKLSLQEGCDAEPNHHSATLPTIVAPQLTDMNGVDGIITGTYRGRVLNPSSVPTVNPPLFSLFSTAIGLNDNYQVGTTYILWEFKDASGNAAYCTQKIVVVDDRPPVVTCPDLNLGEVSNKPGYCGLSVNALISQMKEFPSAKDTCTVGSPLKPVVYYRDVNDADFTEVHDGNFDDIIFYVNESYEIIWRFYKLNDRNNVYEDCKQTFTVRDTEEPYFDCSSLPTVRVTANSYKPKNRGYEYLEYATRRDIAGKWNGEDVIYTGSLKEAFENGDIRMVQPSEVKDNCEGEIDVAIVISGPDKNGRESRTVVGKLSDLENHEFYVGLSTITYTFMDVNNNQSTCVQSVIVTAGTTPIPDCPDPNVTLYADAECKATFSLTKAEVPTAQIPVNQEGLWFNFRHCVIDGKHFGSNGDETGCADVAQYFPNKISDLQVKYTAAGPGGPGGPGANEHTTDDLTIATLCEGYENWNTFKESAQNKWTYWSNSECAQEKVLSESNKLTSVMMYEGYPFEVELIDSLGNTVKKVQNAYSSEDVVPSRIIAPRWYKKGGVDGEECREHFYTCRTIAVKVKNNFSDMIMNETLTKGVYSLIYRFQNEENGLQLDSCVIRIEVADTIAPTLECGDWNKSATLYANDDCVVPIETIPWFKKPTVDDLNVKDNCSTNPGDFTITWNRNFGKFNITADVALTDPLAIGVTTMTWYVTDASGNTSFCQQEFTVVDTTGPTYDCSLLKDIVVETETNCEAAASSVQAAGLDIPYAVDDKCSPTGKPIPGVGVRSDGKDIFSDPYPRGTTVITWTFSDAVGNKTVCTQNVIVEDRTAPVFEKCGKMEEVVKELPAEMCVAPKDMVEAALGSNTAIDDCDGDIPGVPHVLLPGDTVYVDMYQSFKKDTTYTIVWTFTDLSGNTLECNQKLTIKDTTPPDPSGICPPPTKEVYADVDCSVPYDDLQLPSLESMVLVDPCDGDIYPTVEAKVYLPDGSYQLYYNDELKTISYPVGTHTFLWIYEDNAENLDTCQMNLTVIDHGVPVLEDCDVDPEIHLTVDGDICAIDPANVKTHIREPKAYDECDDYLAQTGLSWMTPVIERYFIDSTIAVNAAGDTIGYTYDTTLVADGVSRMWDVDPFPKGLTMLRWIFTDNTGNWVDCKKTVTVHDYTPPYFDCKDIQPDTLRPEAYKGDCEIEFADLKHDVLDKLAYKAYDACTGDSVPGILTLTGERELPEDYTMQVGITYKLIWLFADEDGNKTVCPQYIIPSHTNNIKYDCSAIKDTMAYADEDACTISAENLKLRIPKATDTCALLSGFEGVYEAYGFRSDKLPVNTLFPTGETDIRWMFVSPWNINDTLWCDQKVTILGNKHFKLNCDELTPTRRDTLADCGPTDPLTFVIDTPRVVNPCILSEDDPNYWSVGVGTRSDNKPLDAAFNLGNTTIEWVFTDFTNSIKDTCVQDIIIKTSLEMIFNCDSLNKDTIKVDVKVGDCTVDASKVKDKIVTPFALHPCPAESGVDTIWGVPSRRFGMSMDSSFYVGLSEIVWTFIDPSHTLLHDTMTCSQWVRVGDVNEMPVKCENFPDKVYRLSPDDCEISWKEMDITVPGVVDLCSHEIIDPVVTRSSGKSLTATTSIVGGDTIVSIAAEDFTVGVDTVRWTYSFHGQLFVCDQVITVKDSMIPIYDCKDLQPIIVPAVPGKCYANSSAVFDSLPNPWPQAEDACNQQKIDGRVYLEDGQELTKASSFIVPVGEHVLTWVFIDETINELADTCSQYLLVMGDQAPIFDCDSLKHEPLLIEGCDTTLGKSYIKTPYALDACTNDSVAGVGMRLDKGELYGVYPVGTTSIRWIFVSPYSTLADTCIQDVTVLTRQELDLHCTDVNGDTIDVDVEEGQCYSAVDIKTPFALHPCPEQSKVDTIWGVPFRSDNRAITDSFRTGLTLVTWVFSDNSGTMYKNVDTCYTVVRVGDVNKMPVDCKNMPDTTIILPATDCEISWNEINFTVPEVRDLCSDSLITPTLTRWSGKEMDESFTVGPDTIYWNYNFFGQVITCSQGVLVLDSVAPAFDCSTLKDTVLVAKPGLCDVSSEELKLFLGDPVAIDSCTNAEVHGRAYVCNVISPDGTSASPSQDGGCLSVDEISVKVGDTLSIRWIFQDSLLNAVPKVCEQTVAVKGTAEPLFDCSALKDTILYLELDQCEMPDGKFVIDVPVAKDSCTGTDVPGVGVRRDSMTLTDVYPKGVTVVDWTFDSPYSVTPKTCPQNVIVKDTFPPQFLCESLKDTIKVRITMTSVSETEVSYDEVVTAGLEVPSIKDSCDGVIVAEATRSDGKDLKDNYVLGDPVDITWTFTDASGNERICSQVVLVEDWLIEELVCPSDLDNKVFSCIEDIPEPYEDFASFKAAGGSFGDEKKLLENTFSYENRYEGDSCEMTFTRTYHVEDFRHNDITCQQVVKVKDTIAPTILSGTLRDTVLSCSEEIFSAIPLKAVDNCDPNPLVTVSETNNRSSDPSSCDYSSYDIFRKYVAVDRCGNESEFIQTISIRDTVGPTFSIPDGWRDSVLAKNFKACVFGVPDMTIDARKFVSDDCSENSDITVIQNPAAGTHIDQSMKVWIYAIDKCGNKDSLSRFVIVQQPATIVTLEANDLDTCVSEVTFSLATQNVRFARGFILDELRNGKIRQLPSVFSYDYYRGTSVSEDALMFSDNPYTNLHRFANQISRYGTIEKTQYALTSLTKREQSGYYTFVAMDTTTGCTDTATAYINIAEKPRVRLTSTNLSECEGNMLDLNPYVVCESEMGAPLTASYWTFDSVPFEFEDSIKGVLNRSYDGKRLSYVLENRCGTTSSLNSLFLLCDGDDFGKKTKEDSIQFFGSADRYDLFKKDLLYVSDSILLDVHKRYSPDSILVETEPSNPVRIWRGETVTLKLKTGYDFLSTEWYRVVNRFDREFYNNLTSNYDYYYDADSTRAELEDEEDELLFTGTAENSYIEDMPQDTSYYYVVINDGVCPSAASSLIRVDVVTRIPTAFTPFSRDGLNDFFMERHPVTIFDRYGQKVFQGLNGWDGTHNGHRADPGVYFYEVVMIDGTVMKGSVEIVKIK